MRTPDFSLGPCGRGVRSGLLLVPPEGGTARGVVAGQEPAVVLGGACIVALIVFAILRVAIRRIAGK